MNETAKTYDVDQLRNELIIHEGKRLEAYKDSVGYWTIGIGHCLGTKKTRTHISEDECERLFRSDIINAEENLDRIVPFWKELDSIRQRVLVNMSFNLGGNLRKLTTFINSLRNGKYTEAAHAMLASKWAKQVGRRATYLAALMLNSPY